jgi:cytochrome b6-f complex iron-sulfur subunit
MAKKLSIKEKLEAARRGGPATPGDSPAEASPAAEAAAEPVEEAAAEPAAAPPAPAPAPSLGRPLTLKEKLAAARAGGSAPAAAPKPAASAEASEAAPAAPAVAATEGAKTVPAPPPSIGRPLTLKEKLAAAKTGGTAPAAGAAPAAKPAAKPAAAAAAKPAVAKRELPPLEKITDPKDLAEALRQTGAKKVKETEEAAKAKSAPAAKPAKEKEVRPSTVLPRPSKAAFLMTAAEMSRRTMFSALGVIIIGWLAFTAASIAFTQMLVRFMFPNVLAEPPSTVKVGLPSNFEPDSVSERFKAEAGFWIVRSSRYNGQDIIYAIQSVCTHLGCPPNWLAAEQKFKCPCHGSGFYISGVNFEGPAPRPLERFKVSLADDGQMMVDKSQKFQEELGQWSDPDSFVNA